MEGQNLKSLLLKAINEGRFDADEFRGDAMKAAMQDISDSGEEFVPLGQSKFEKNMDPEEFVSDLERADLELPDDEEELNRLQKRMDIQKAHNKRFGSGSMNEDFEDKERHFDTKSLYHYFKDALNQLENFSPEEAAQILESTFKRDWPMLEKHLNENKIKENTMEKEKIKVSRPKDSEGNDLRYGIAVIHVPTKKEGKIVRFGVSGTGKELVVEVDWFDKMDHPAYRVLPTELLVRKKTDEGMGHSHTIGKGQNAKPSNYPETLEREGMVNENKQVEIKNIDALIRMTFPNQKRMNNILKSINEEIENNRIVNNVISAVDEIDSQWLFEVKSITDNKIELMFTHNNR